MERKMEREVFRNIPEKKPPLHPTVERGSRQVRVKHFQETLVLSTCWDVRERLVMVAMSFLACPPGHGTDLLGITNAPQKE
jgi:hypothetical protein